MIMHLVLFRLRSNLSAEAVEELFADLDGLRQRIPGITSFSGGLECSPEGRGRGFTHAFAMTFRDATARDNYLPHPAHDAVAQRLLSMLDGPEETSLLVFDYES